MYLDEAHKVLRYPSGEDEQEYPLKHYVGGWNKGSCIIVKEER